MKIKEVMTRDVATVRPGASLKEVASILAERRISGLPVVDEEGRLLGVVSEADILFKERGPSKPTGVLGRLLDPYRLDDQLKLDARTAKEAMTAPALTIGPERPVSEAAAKMIDDGVNRLPVVDVDGALLGIVTRADLVRAFVRSDEEIAQEIREDVLARTLWMNGELLTVSVTEGDVVLGGSVESESEAELATAFTRRVPGVVSVQSRLRWPSDERRR